MPVNVRQAKLRPDAAKASGRYPSGVLENPKPIARRFAYSADLRQAALHPADALRTALAGGATTAESGTGRWAQGRQLFRSPFLATGIVLAALVPCLILGGLWLGSRGGAEPPRSASSDPAGQISAVLTVPDRIEAMAGETVSFPIALDGTDGVPARSVIAVKGLPRGSNFSEGRPYGEREWNLTPDQIGDLRLVLPSAANGEFKLSIALIAPDDKVIAEAGTVLAAAPAPVPAEQVAAGEGGATSMEGHEAVAPALNPVPDANLASMPATIPGGGEVAALASGPEAAPGDGAEPDGVPTLAESATAPSEQAPPSTVGQAKDVDSDLGTVEPSVFVNMREKPSSSSPVLGVIAKGAELPVLDRKRGWVQVTHPENGKQGWIYSGLLVGEAKPNQRVRRVAPAEAAPEPESLWGKVGRWLSPTPEQPNAN